MGRPEDTGEPTRPKFDRTFRGYSPEAVDEYLDRMSREVSTLQAALRALRAERDVLQAEITRFREGFPALESQVANLRAQLEEAQAELQRAREEREGDGATLRKQLDDALAQIEALRAEKTSADEVLRAAKKAADEMIQEAQKHCDDLMRTAERRVAFVYQDMRAKQRALQEEYEQMLREYERFLSDARALAQSFITKIDERTEGR